MGRPGDGRLMQQRSFGSVEYEHKRVKAKRQTFLERMDGLVPWAELEERIAPVYQVRVQIVQR